MEPEQDLTPDNPGILTTEPSPTTASDRPAGNPRYFDPEATAVHNMTLQEAYKTFHTKKVRIKSTGQIGTVVGVDPRPVRGGPDGCFLCISVPRNALPGRVPTEHIHALVDDVELVSSQATTTT